MTINTIYSDRKTYIALSVVFLYTISLVLYFDTLYWPFGTIDSPIILAQAILYSPLEYFGSPDKYQFLTYNNLTPWITLSWDLDNTLFQLEPWGYRLHQLLSAAALLGVVYLLLYRLTHSILNTAIFCFAIIILPATFNVVTDLVNRHYLEGMIFCLLSVLLAEAYTRQRAIKWLVISVLFYGLSMAAKEVFIPLPGILFFFFPGSFRRKFTLIIPYAVTLMAYLVWRVYMLSGSGGYSSTDSFLDLFDNSQVIVHVARLLLDSFFVNAPVTLFMFAMFAVLLVSNFHKLSLYARTGFLVGALGVLLPLVALLPIMSFGIFSERWLFAPSVAFLIYFSYLCAITTSRKLSGVAYIVVLSCSVGATSFYLQQPTPLFVKSKGSFYTQILKSEPDSYHYMQNYSLLAARGQAVWAYIAKLHNGKWGTLPISDLGQLRYHETEHKKAIVMGRNKKRAVTSYPPAGEDLNLVESAHYDPLSGSLTFSFNDNLASEHCFIYIFGAHSGLLNNAADCKQWSIQYRELMYLLRMRGYSLSDVSVAVWTENPAERLYSRPYKLDQLIDLDE